MNSYDSDRILESVQNSHSAVSRADQADVIVFNTCHIRERAAEKIYSEVGMLKELKENNKDLKLIITGCVAQAENEEMLKREPYIDIVIGPQSYHKINDTILNHIKKNKKVEVTEFDPISKFTYFSKIKNNTGKISSFLTIHILPCHL